MFNRIGPRNSNYSEPKTRLWLTWLAARMGEDSLGLLRVEDLEPHWLPNKAWRWAYSAVSCVCSSAALAAAGILVFPRAIRPALITAAAFAVATSLVDGWWDFKDRAARK
jgi:hypothetical protein